MCYILWDNMDVMYKGIIQSKFSFLIKWEEKGKILIDWIAYALYVIRYAKVCVAALRNILHKLAA